MNLVAAEADTAAEARTAPVADRAAVAGRAVEADKPAVVRSVAVPVGAWNPAVLAVAPRAVESVVTPRVVVPAEAPRTVGTDVTADAWVAAPGFPRRVLGGAVWRQEPTPRSAGHRPPPVGPGRDRTPLSPAPARPDLPVERTAHGSAAPVVGLHRAGRRPAHPAWAEAGWLEPAPDRAARPRPGAACRPPEPSAVQMVPAARCRRPRRFPRLRPVGTAARAEVPERPDPAGRNCRKSYAVQPPELLRHRETT